MRPTRAIAPYAGYTIDVPEQGKLTLDEAHDWMEQAGAKIKYFLDDKASLQEQAAQAVQLSNAIVAAARNAMQNAQAASQLNLTFPLATFAQWKRRLGSEGAGSSGDALYKAIIEAAEAQTKRPGEACFVAGTLVHTKEGLVPIEKIKVGDYVLSKPESGEGELSYQRVAKTFVHEDQPVLCVDVNGWTVEERDAAELSRTLLGCKHFPLVVTAGHPFWVIGKGWVRADKLKPGEDVLLMENGSFHRVYDVSAIVQTLQENLGWLIGGVWCPIKFTNEESRWVDFSGDTVRTEYAYENQTTNEGIEWWEQNESDRLKRTVYNIEVENTHTYFVGERGVWVHNKSVQLHGEAYDLALEEARNYVLPPHGTRAYYTEGEARKYFAQKLRPDDGSQPA